MTGQTRIAGKPKEQWIRELPLLRDVLAAREVFWTNPQVTSVAGRAISPSLGLADIEDAARRLQRFAPYIAQVFPETQASQGLIESELVPIPALQHYLETTYGQPLGGTVYLKKDSHLPISGSVKARGGIYEILKVAEDIARQHQLLAYDDDYRVLATEPYKRLFSQYTIAVGSTGNLGLSIGIMSARLGFNVQVHMSADAKQWKKDLLRQKGAVVIEYESDYERAVAAGRKQCEGNPHAYFVDDEQSTTLFLGYAVAALRLQQQLRERQISVDTSHPVFFYLPCGVGGAPGGITFGLRTVFGDAVHCFFAEPTQAPAMLLGLMTQQHDAASAQAFGMETRTEADGLAVGRPSGLVGKMLARDISGVFTTTDAHLYQFLRALADTEGIYVEPSAVAGMAGPVRLEMTDPGRAYLDAWQLTPHLEGATHIVWATGGSMVPPAVMQDFYHRRL